MLGDQFKAGIRACLGGRPPPERLGLAVSGGSDSMALLHLAGAWGAEQSVEFTVFTVDHGLRPEAGEEAAFVAAQALRAGFPHQTLNVHWPDGPPKSNIQSKARIARYEAMAKAAQALGIDHLLTAHTEDDQAETFLLRLARGSGLDGLTAMASRTSLFGLLILRPLLSCGKEELRAMLRANNLGWIDDPSNADPQFARVRMRALLPEIAVEGMTVKRLARTARELRIARDALEKMASQVLDDHGEIAPQGYVTLNLTGLRQAPKNIGLRAVARVLRTVSPRAYHPRAGRLDALYDRLMEAGPVRRSTLGGCVITREKDMIRVYREMRSPPDPLPVAGGQKLVWESQFDLSVGEAVSGDCEIRALGRPAFEQLKRDARVMGYRPPKDPWHANLPSLWARDQLLSAPFWPRNMGVCGPQCSMLEARFRPVRLGFAT